MRTLNLFLLFFFLFALNSYSLPKCEGDDFTKWNNCYGTYTFPSGTKYVGEWKFHSESKNGMYHGQGTETFASGAKYVGEHKDGNRHGQGTYTFGKGPWEGDKYVGEWKDNNPHGQGTHTFANGTKWEGLWVEGEFKGEKVEEIKTNVTLKKYYNTKVTPRGFFRGIYYWVGNIVCSVTYNLGITGDCGYKNRIQTGMIIFWLLLITIVGGLFGNRKKF
jgi:hypothetical protein